MLTRSSRVAGVYDVLQQMISLGVPVSVETLYDQVVPGLVQCQQSTDAIVDGLRTVGLTLSETINGIVRYHIGNNHLTDAIKICEHRIHSSQYF